MVAKSGNLICDHTFDHLIDVQAASSLPIIGRDLPLVADAFVDPAFGTGAVKVTPGHDPNDFAIGRRHSLPTISVIDEDGRMTAERPGEVLTGPAYTADR